MLCIHYIYLLLGASQGNVCKPSLLFHVVIRSHDGLHAREDSVLKSRDYYDGKFKSLCAMYRH